jgi:hypothetical protein
MNFMSKALLVATTLIFTVCILVGQSKYSGVYSGKVSGHGFHFLASSTAGGRIMTDYSESSDNINPYKSIVSAKGKFTAVSHDGSISATGTATSKFTFSGTAKSGGDTYRISGKRILK